MVAGITLTLQDATPPLPLLRRRSTPFVPTAGAWHGDAPRLRPGIVARPRLLRRLLTADAPIVMIVAPAGYGKTTLLAEWAMRDPRPFAWLSVEALSRAGDRAVVSLAGLVEDVGACLTPHVIVLDDAHHLATDLSMRRITDLACRLPVGSCVAVASRRRFAVPLARLRGHGLLAELAARELAMTRLEAAMLLDNAGVRLEAGQVDRLVALTEGWPVGLYLAALSIQEQDGSQEAITQLGGGDRLVADYIRDEVLRDLAEHEVAFLRRTSILRRISAPLCDAVLESRDSAAVLARLTRGDIPIEPVDRSDLRFRCNRLLAEMLHTDLVRDEPQLEPVLHRRAADWHTRHGEVREALRHAVACRDGARAAPLLWSVAPGCAALGSARAICECLEPFSPAEMRAHPGLALSAAAYHLAEGRRDKAEHWADVAALAPNLAGDAGELAGSLAMVRACLASRGMTPMGRDAARACANAPLDGSWQSVGRLLRGVAHQLTGEPDTAQECLEEGARLAGTEVPIVAALCHAQLALLAVHADDWGDAAARAEQARAALVEVPVTAAGHALVLAVSAVTAAHRGDVFDARRDADTAFRLLETLPSFVPWYMAEAQIALARAEIRLSNGDRARVLLTRAAHNQGRAGDAHVLGEWLHMAWERADTLAAGATGGGPALTKAELRVLRLLPSHLSLREIGARLHVSTSTVKTQALAVYRKLNVSCRSDAVARGRSAGLIDG
jgi:ATP/maltotriose-dependent transcriptional regulator MalT